ncbi:VENN motif pre-toxin domain-containing protein [Pectobacterium peruviense]|uniref:VENN motif pre-toxin domain-containing protein n=1 Tax=Pectobacterium peruviense TaxID=2066479 RepID=UPI000ACEEF44|nr:VENN motif pre-toxin domain-containing protein [Pectobacterium peruviense]
MIPKSNVRKTAIQALAGGDIQKAIASGASPYLAQLVKDVTMPKDESKATASDIAANAMAHAVVGAVVAQLSGQDAAAGALGASSGELAARAIMAKEYPGKTANDLTEAEKQSVSALSTLAAGLVSGLASNSTASAASGAQSGRNAVENNSLAGDKARQSVKESAEWWKQQVRDKLGEGTTSAIANSIINAVADTGDTGDTGDAALGGTDYVADGAMALASCAVGDGYCNKALSDLAGKNQAAADAVKALMKSETWSAVADTLKQASGGNQAALEATGGILASIFLPGKKVPEFGAVLGKTEKLVKNADGIYEVKVNVTPLEGHVRLNTPDLGGNGKLKPAEAASAAQLEPTLGTMERYTPSPGTKSGTSPDFVITSGPNKGKTVDAMYTTDRLSQKEIDGLNKFYEKNMSVGSGRDVIQDHLQKADFVPVDFRVLTPANQKTFMDYIKTLPKAQQDKVIIMR